MDITNILSFSWSLLQQISLGVGINELHRQLVNRLKKKDAGSINIQIALYLSLLESVDTLSKTLSNIDHPYFKSIANLQDRREEQKRVNKVFKLIQAHFPSNYSIQKPIELILAEDRTRYSINKIFGDFGLKTDLASLPNILRNAFEANLPFVMLAHFRQRVATDESLHALLQLDITTSGFQAVQRELHLISTFLREHCGSDNPATIKVWSETLTIELKNFISAEFAEVKDEMREVKKSITQLERTVDELPEKILSVLSAIDLDKAPHLSSGFYLRRVPLTWTGDSLPYHQLGGPGLERLCYLLLLAVDKVPRYFGKPGQKQYGVDLLVTEGEKTTVYQCKNFASFSLVKVKQALQHFEQEWLDKEELPRPTEFVLCCPLPLHERQRNENWLRLERQFKARTGVSVAFWDRNYLDERLRRLPDIVADLFSDHITEQFCDLQDWNSDLFRPLVANCGERTIERYLAQKEAGRLYIDPKIEDTFREKLLSNESLLIRGLPGTGKTITGLAMAESFDYQNCSYRIFYINMKYDLNEDVLVKGVQRRLTQPTIFFFDDCQGKYEMLDAVQNRLRKTLYEKQNKGLLVFTTRTVPTPKGMPRGDYSDFGNTMLENDAVLDFHPTLNLFYQIIIKSKPNFIGLSKERLKKIYEFTGHDLFLLDQFLETIGFPDQIDKMVPENLFEETLKRYFGAPTVHRPGFMKLAALAQFDLAPPVSYFESKLELEDEKAANQLLVIADRPPCYYFLHSTAAELVFRALAWNQQRNKNYHLAIADYLISFFKSRPFNDNQLVEDLRKIIHNHLKLAEEQIVQNSLRSRFLAYNEIYNLIESNFEKITLNSIAVCLIILCDVDKKIFECYFELVQRMIDNGTVLKMIIERPFWETGFFMGSIKRTYTILLTKLRSQFLDMGLPSLIKLTELQNFLSLLSNFSDPNDSSWLTSLDLVQPNEINEMIQRTINSGRSIGALDLGLRALKKNNSKLLEKIEHKIGSKRYLQLIISVGTIVEFLRIIQYSSHSMAEELIENIDTNSLDTLIANTITSHRSIGTLDLTLRQFKKSDPILLEKLDRKIGANRYLRLIANNGTISELFRIIKHSSLSMAEELIESIDAYTLHILIAKTISSSRSIGIFI
ncbi:MAG: hypothetical protein ACFFCW_28670 [Candidatus Hodarchaeota archaeon]